MKKPEPTKTLQLRVTAHQLLKMHCARTHQNMGDYAATAIREKIKRDKAKK